MRPLLALAATTLAVTTSCTSTSPLDRGSITPTGLAAITASAPPAGTGVKITAKVVLPSGETSLSLTVTTRFGQTATMEQIREFIYPTDFTFPQVAPIAGSPPSAIPITPVTPEKFTTKNLGWTLTLTPEKRSGTVLVKGNADFIIEAGSADAPGEPFSPVVTPDGITLTDNRAQLPHFTTYTTPILVAASTMGKPYRLPLSHPEKGTYLEISIDEAP